MHPVGQSWVSSHGDAADDGRAAQCQACHGTDYRGTVLSRAQGDRTISAFGSKLFWKGFQVGCYTCHNGPNSESATANPPATVRQRLRGDRGRYAGDDPALRHRPQRQLAHPPRRIAAGQRNGGVDRNQSHLLSRFASFTGTDTFTFAAWNGSTDSNLGTVTVAVAGGTTCTVTAQATVPSTGTVGQLLAFQGSATSQGCGNPVSYSWNFGDGSNSSLQNPTHAYAAANTYSWTLMATSGSSTSSKSGTISVTAPACTITASATVPASGTAGSAIQFQGSAASQGCSGTPAYAWTFGDGSDSSQQNPTHAYSTANTYTWRLTASVGGSSNSVTGTIAVASAPACSLFITGAAPTSALVGQSVSFPLTVKATGCSGSISYRWNFGDGTDGSTKAQPTHTYRSTGTYSWRLNATIGSTSADANGKITVSSRPRRRF